jgi:molybdopterin molybdotransferase
MVRDEGKTMDFLQCIPLSEAQDRVAESLTGIVADAEIVDLADSLGRIAAERIVAQENLPPFSRSTVDGYAVRSADTFGASESSPSLFSIIGEVSMGQQAAMELLSGQAVVIPTGGMLPKGADAVVMLEYTEQPDSNTLLVLKTAAPGENIVARGEDLQLGSTIIDQGQRIAPKNIGALAACGCTHVPVRKRLKVAIISTGDELVDIDQPLSFGQIRDINSFALGAMLSEIGCTVRRLGIVKDDFKQFFAALSDAVATCQLVIISGGSSVGARDYTVKAIDALGKPGILVHGISVKPGKPTIYGIVGKVPVFGLPGHPVAAMTVCEQLVKPAARKLMGQTRVLDNLGVPAQIRRNVASAPGRDDFINVRLSKQDDGYVATPLLGKSGLISIMAQADGMIHIPSNKSGLYDGDLVKVVLTKNLE